MTAEVIMYNKTSNGIGSVLTSGGAMAAYALTLSGKLDGAFCSIIADINGGSDYVRVGSLSEMKPAALLMLPAGTKITCRLDGAKVNGNTNVTIYMGN